jgi:hypothetical protein
MHLLQHLPHMFRELSSPAYHDIQMMVIHIRSISSGTSNEVYSLA